MSEIEKTEWPVPTNRGYVGLVERAIANPGQTFRMPLSSGRPGGAYTAVRGAARTRGVAVEVKTSQGYVYVRVPKADTNV